MGTINTKRIKKTAKGHSNFMGGTSFFCENPIDQLKLAASSCFFGEPMYYHKDKDASSKESKEKAPGVPYGTSYMADLRKKLEALDPSNWRNMTPTELMVDAIDKALDYDAEATLAFAADLRNNQHIRTTPQVILVRAAHHPDVRGTTLISEYGPQILKRVDETTVQFAYHLSAYGENKPVPNSLKRLWNKFLSFQSNYHLAKYRMENHVVKLVDVVNISHPKSEAIGQLVKGTLKNEFTWESIISAKGSKKESWIEAIEYMGHMALLRNLRNFDQAGVPEKAYLKKLVEGAADGKQLPFRYYSAYKALPDASGPVKEAIEECLELSMGAMPKFTGRSMFLCDNSGSARGATTSSLGTMSVAEIANLTGVIGAHLSEDGHVGVFGDRLITLPISKKGSIFEQVTKVTSEGDKVGQNTEHGIWVFLDKAISEKQHWDNIFIMSDMQAGHGGLYGTPQVSMGDRILGRGHAYVDVPKMINRYRSEVNKNVNVFLIQIAGHQDTLIPEFYKRTYILSGWSDGVFKFAHQMAKLMDGQQ